MACALPAKKLLFCVCEILRGLYYREYTCLPLQLDIHNAEMVNVNLQIIRRNWFTFNGMVKSYLIMPIMEIILTLNLAQISFDTFHTLLEKK